MSIKAAMRSDSLIAWRGATATADSPSPRIVPLPDIRAIRKVRTTCFIRGVLHQKTWPPDSQLTRLPITWRSSEASFTITAWVRVSNLTPLRSRMGFFVAGNSHNVHIAGVETYDDRQSSVVA